MAASFADFVSMLGGVLPLPNTKFVCYKGILREDELDELARVIRGNRTVTTASAPSPGFKLQGRRHVTTTS